MQTRYSRWDGTQEPLEEDIQIGDLIDEISSDILSGVGPRRAIKRLLRRGIEGRTRGLDDLRARLAARHRQWAQSTNLEGPLSQVRDRLNAILASERAALETHDTEDARSREAFLDSLPEGPTASLKELMDYRFIDEGAEEKFDELIEELQHQVMEAYLGQMRGALETMSPESIARTRQMLAELNQILAARQRGEEYDFEGFIERYRDFFPENPRNLDELLEALAARMAAMSRLLASLSPEQRKELEDLSTLLMKDLDLAFEFEMLNQELRELAPNLPWDERVFGMGDDPEGLPGTVNAIQQLSEMEDLDRSLTGGYPGASIEDIDERLLRKALGEPAVESLRSLKQIEKTLEEAGIVSQEQGRMEMTARGIRRLGERALVHLFEVLKQDRPGGHETRTPGGAAEPTGATRPWRFGDSGQISVQKTVFNSVVRTAGAKEKLSGNRMLQPEDFELIEAESRTLTATALLLDLSFSMTLRDHWVPAKKMALALQALIETKYPQDHLYLIGFSDYARELKPADLTATGPIERVYGTNMQHAFMLAGRLLADHPRASKQVIMVTDGEPTAHLESSSLPSPQGPLEGAFDGPHAVFSWPPTSETIHKTLAEATRLSSCGVTLNIFMLENEPGLIHFMDELAQRTSGRVFQAAGEDIGRFVLRDFVRRR